MQKTLVIAGLVLVLVGLFWPWISKLPLGRLPGDLSFERDNLRVFFPVTTMIVVSVVLSLILWFLRR